MQAKGKSVLSEYKVGIFVVAALAILAVAIFTIGTRAAQRHHAKTYLNTGRTWPGDVVLLWRRRNRQCGRRHITCRDVFLTHREPTNTQLITQALKIEQLETSSCRFSRMFSTVCSTRPRSRVCESLHRRAKSSAARRRDTVRDSRAS
jgi:hypothetical protein